MWTLIRDRLRAKRATNWRICFAGTNRENRDPEKTNLLTAIHRLCSVTKKSLTRDISALRAESSLLLPKKITRNFELFERKTPKMSYILMIFACQFRLMTYPNVPTLLPTPLPNLLYLENDLTNGSGVASG